MNETSSWSIYSTRDGESEGPWRSSTSMNAISFGLVATAILISMFLIMAIFEHLFRPENSTFDSPHRIRQRQSQSRDGSTQFQKLAHQASMSKRINLPLFDINDKEYDVVGSGEYGGGCVGSDAGREAAVAHSFAGSFTLSKRRPSLGSPPLNISVGLGSW
ncbi:unnamed protein product, partial [Thlaspi arvense]